MKRWWIQIARYALSETRGLWVVLVLMIVGVGLNVIKPWPLKLIVDYALKGKPLPEAFSMIGNLPGLNSPIGLLAWLSAATVLVFLAHQSITIIQGYVRAGVGARMVYNLGSNLFDRLQHLSLRFHGRQRAGDLVRRVTTDSGCVRELVMGTIFPALTSVVSLCMMFAVMWKLERSLAVLALFIAPGLVFFIRLLNRPMTERAYQYQQLEGEMMALAEQTLSSIPVVQAFGREAYEDKRWQGLSRRTLHAYLRTILSQMQFKIGVSGTTALGTAIVMVSGGLFVLKGSLTVGGLIVFLSYVAALYAPMETLAYSSSGYASAAAKARRVIEVMKADDKVQELPEAKSFPMLRGRKGVRVRFENVTFGYEPDRSVLKDVNLQVKPGETVALVGPTGAGKSTLVSLILRFLDPWEGHVSFDGIDVSKIKLSDMRAQVAIVLQEPFLLPLTIAENIAYGRQDASQEEIKAAAMAANADEFILQLPDGYDTVIGEQGATLSGGQKQRLAIARALLKDAPVLILDEPTSSLDARTEVSLLDALDRLMEGRTTFIIAHRLSTIRRADRIVVLEEGKVVEIGSHKRLMGEGGSYHRFHVMQFGRTTSVLA